jgi:hypothetical protein
VEQQVAEEREPFGLRECARAKLRRVEVERALERLGARLEAFEPHVVGEPRLNLFGARAERPAQSFLCRRPFGEQRVEAFERVAPARAAGFEQVVYECPGLGVEERALPALGILRRALVYGQERRERDEALLAQLAQAVRWRLAERDAAAV